MFWVKVSTKASFPDPEGGRLARDIRDIGIPIVQKARVSDVYLLEGELEVGVAKIGREPLENIRYGVVSWRGMFNRSAISC